MDDGPGGIMTTRSLHSCYKLFFLIIAIAAWPATGSAQVPVADNEDQPVLTAAELEGLVGAIALYPDDLLAIVLPASTFPFQIVEAARFLEKLETDSTLEPDDDWDDSVVALTNYPEVLEMMNEDLDWTWRLGEAVVAQQADVIAAVERFRDRAYAAGNLKSDDYQTVTEEDGVIEITPVREDVIYVPYYEPAQVVVYQPRPVYYYYPRAYPLYYYPYPYGYAFDYSYFWGVTTAYSIGWFTDRLHVYHHSYHGHRYYGHSYWNHHWYRAPDIHVHNSYYVNNYVNVSISSYGQGDYWQPQPRRTVRFSDRRITRTRYYPNSSSRSRTTTNSFAGTSNSFAGTSNSFARTSDRPKAVRSSSAQRMSSLDARRSGRSAIEFRDRSDALRKTTTLRTAKREPVEKRASMQTRRSQERQAQPRQTQVREAPAKQVQRRQTQVREAPARQVQRRQTQVREVPTRQAQPRQTQVREAPTRQVQRRQSQVREVPTRQAQPRQSEARQSPPKQSQSKPSQSRSPVKVARNSRSENSHRDH
jgi:hypothetical protein